MLQTKEEDRQVESVLQRPRWQRKAAARRPFGVTILGIAMVIAGITFALAGASFFFAGTREIRGTIGASTVISGLAAAAGVIFLLFGILHIIFALGLLQLREAARILTVLLFGLSLLGAAIGGVLTLSRLNVFAFGWDVFVLLSDVVAIWYLSSNRVKPYFEGQAPHPGKSLRTTQESRHV